MRQEQQSQSLAYSLDRGRSWRQYAGNPVLEGPPASYQDAYREFRDPKVFCQAPEAKWVMVVVLAQQHKAMLYASRDLLDWEFMSEFGPAGATGDASFSQEFAARHAALCHCTKVPSGCIS